MVYIQADNSEIGLVCVVLVGIGEISSCDITVRVGDHVAKGEELGMFHYGGSSFSMIVGPDIDLEWSAAAKEGTTQVQNIPVNSQIARVRASM
jgi:phosphatidylserine decarboxylase